MSRINGYGPSLIVLTTAVVVLLGGPVAVRKISFAHTEADIREASLRLGENALLAELSQAFRDIATVVEPSVVHVSTEHIMEDRFGHQGRKSSSGSGWVYDEDGHVVTNHHVIEDALRIEVQLHDGEIREAEVVGGDPTTDIAVLRIAPGRLHPATLRDPVAETIGQGEMVFAFGSPFDFRFSMSSGVVSGKGRSVGVIRDAYGVRVGYENFIQVDAAINPGNSGGPLTDYRGRVIGMNTAIATGPRRQGQVDDGQFAGIGLAIPVEMIVPVVTQLIENDGVVAKGYLGVSVVDPSNDVAEDLTLLPFRGFALVVGHLPPGHAAWDAGLRYGDLVTHVHGVKVVTVDQMLQALEGVESDEVVPVTVWRYDADENTSTTLELGVPGVVAARGFRGVTFLQADDTIKDALAAVGFTGQGVRVARLVPDAPAQRSGLRRGDVVTRVNGQPVTTVQQLRSMISSMLPGDDVRLQVWRYEPARDDARTMEIVAHLVRLNTLELFGELPADQSLDEIRELGIGRMTTSTRELARDLDIEYHPGVVIVALIDGSELAGQIEPGSIVVEVMQSQVRNTEEFVDALRGYNLRRTYGVQVTVVRPDGSVDRVRLRVGQ